MRAQNVEKLYDLGDFAILATIRTKDTRFRPYSTEPEQSFWLPDFWLQLITLPATLEKLCLYAMSALTSNIPLPANQPTAAGLKAEAAPRLGPSGIVVTAVVLLAIQLLNFTPYRLSNPGSFYFTLVVYAAINNGLRYALGIAALTWCYSAYHFIDSPLPALWSHDSRVRLILQAFNLSVVAILVGVLQQRAQKLRESQMATHINEISLRQSRDWLATTLQSIGDAVIATDASGSITFLNDAAQQLTGWGANEAVDRPIEEVFRLIQGETREAVASPARRAIEAGAVVSLSNGVCLCTRDGREIPIDDSAAPIRDSTGKLIGAVVVFRDVSARKEAAKALERSETLFRATVEESPIAILICAADGSVLRTNNAWEKLYGVSRDELHDYNLRQDTQLAALGYAPLIERAFAGETVELPLINYDPALIGKRGHACLIRTFAYPVKDNSGHVAEVVLMIEDVTERQQTLEAVRQGEQRYQSLVRATAQIVWTAAPNGQAEDIPTWREFSGQTQDEVRDWGWLDAVHPDDRAPTAAAWQKAVDERQPYIVEYRVRRSDGVYRLFAVRGIPVLEDNGTLREWVGSCTDVTTARRDAALLAGQKRVLERIARGDALEDILRTLADVVQEQTSTLCSIMLLSEDGQKLRLVAGPRLPDEYIAKLKAMGGVPVGPLCGSCGTAAFLGQFVSASDMSIDPIWQSAWPLVEHHGLRSCWSQPIFDSDKRVVGTFAMYQTEVGEPETDDLHLIQAAADLAEIAIARTLIERNLRLALARETQAAAQMGTILRHIDDGVVVTDASGRIAFANDAARSIHGVSELGDTLEEYGRIRPRFDRNGSPLSLDELPIMRAWHSGQDVIGEEWQIERPDGERVWVQGSATSLPALDASEKSAHRGVVLTLHDVTDARRVVQELQHASQMKDEFLAVLSHELRTPLTPILGWASLLRRARHDENGMFEQAVSSIERNAELQKRLVNDLLDTSRIISGKLGIEPNQSDLNSVADLALRTVADTSTARAIKVVQRFDENLTPFDFDNERIQQVMLNLLFNAAKFSPDGATIELETALEETSKGGRRARVTVRDNGEGIALDFLPHVFDVFRQGDSSFTRRHGGMGLGLAIARSIVELHGGTMEAHSDGVASGAAFTFWLPVTTSQSIRPSSGGHPEIDRTPHEA